jgi:hypothetical protein
MGMTLYVYTKESRYVGCKADERYVNYIAIFEINKQSYVLDIDSWANELYREVRESVDVTPRQMNYLYDIILSHYEERGKEDGLKYKHMYCANEPIDDALTNLLALLQPYE